MERISIGRLKPKRSEKAPEWGWICLSDISREHISTKKVKDEDGNEYTKKYINVKIWPLDNDRNGYAKKIEQDTWKPEKQEVKKDVFEDDIPF